MAKLKKSTLDGNVETMLMSVLAAGPSYGYEIVRELNERAAGLLALGEGTVYPVLHRLEERGWISSRWDTKTGKRPRKYYRLTAKGRSAMTAQRQQWQGLVAVMDRVLGHADSTQSPITSKGV